MPIVDVGVALAIMEWRRSGLHKREAQCSSVGVAFGVQSHGSAF